MLCDVMYVAGKSVCLSIHGHESPNKNLSKSSRSFKPIVFGQRGILKYLYTVYVVQTLLRLTYIYMCVCMCTVFFMYESMYRVLIHKLSDGLVA